MLTNLFKASLIILILLSLACTNTNKEQPKPSGSIVGKVTLYGLFKNEITDKDGVLIEVYQDQKIVSTTATDGAGGFALHNLPLGEYVLRFKKENFSGFDFLKVDHKSIVDSLFFIQLAETPPARAILMSVSSDYDKLSDRLISPFTAIYFNLDEWYMTSTWYYYSKNYNVSANNYTYRVYECCVGGNTKNPIMYSAGVKVTEFYKNGFATGDKIYVVAYVGNSTPVYYNNPNKGFNYYTFPTHSNVPSNSLSFILP